MNDYRQTSSVTTMLKTRQWQPLAERRTRCKAVMMYRIVRILNGLVAIPPLELHTTSSVTRDHIARFLVPYAKNFNLQAFLLPRQYKDMEQSSTNIGG